MYPAVSPFQISKYATASVRPSNIIDPSTVFVFHLWSTILYGGSNPLSSLTTQPWSQRNTMNLRLS